jgi:hypothetical protein
MSMDPSKIPPNVPVNPPPPGVKSNFEHPDTSRYAQIVATMVVCTTLSTICFFARVYTRVYLVKKFGWDDGETAYNENDTILIDMLTGL